MDPITFNIIPGTDKEYYDAFENMRKEGLKYEKATFGNLSQMTPSELESDADFQAIINENMRVFHRVIFQIQERLSVTIQRQPEEKSLFDKVSVNRPDNANQLQVAKIVAAVQKHLGETSILNVGNLLGPAATQHFEAREIALARLEKLSASVLEEMEEARKQREKAYHAKQETLAEQFKKRSTELEEQYKQRQEKLSQRAAELDNRSKELDDRAAKHARRQHYKEIKEKFESWNEKFQVTPGTSSLRRSVFWTTLALLILFGGLAGWFIMQSIAAQDTSHLIAAVVKQITFTLLFVSTAFFFIRWNNQWFQRHADEEFRLKRMELDIDRASWFVEMAFEWKEEKGEEIPLEIIERLTQGLFYSDSSSHSVEPADSLMQALVGAARFKVKLADGSELEYDRKGIQQLLRKQSEDKA